MVTQRNCQAFTKYRRTNFRIQVCIIIWIFPPFYLYFNLNFSVKSRAWTSKSPLWDAIERDPNGVPGWEDVSLPSAGGMYYLNFPAKFFINFFNFSVKSISRIFKFFFRRRIWIQNSGCHAISRISFGSPILS